MFKLHNPSRRRRALLLDAMKRAHRAYDKALTAVRREVEALEGLAKRERAERLKLLRRRIAAIVRPLPLGCGPKAAVAQEVLAAATSYLELRARHAAAAAGCGRCRRRAADPAAHPACGEHAAPPAYPTCARLSDRPAAYVEALERFAAAVDEDGERATRAELARADGRGRVRPLGIYRNRPADGFLLLRDGKGRLFAWINLHPAGSRFASPVVIRDMIECRTGEPLSFTSTTGELFPLACGADFHVRRHLEAGTVRSGRLTHDGDHGAFYLHVAFAFTPAPIEPRTWLGVDVGVDRLASWAVVDASGLVVERGFADGAALRRRQRAIGERIRAEQRRYGIARSRPKLRAYADQAVHAAANAIVGAARRHAARVVVEDVASLANGPHHKRPKGERRSRLNVLLNRAQYRKLQRVVGYKLAGVGLPVERDGLPLRVQAGWTSRTCFACGHTAAASRRAPGDPFLCVACGHGDDSDLNAGAVIALKGRWWCEVGRPHWREGERPPEEFGFKRFLRDMAAGRPHTAVEGADAP